MSSTFAKPSPVSAYRQSRTPKQLEAEVFARATQALRHAETSGDVMDRTRAVADNWRLWDAVLSAVLDPSNALPVALRAQIASLARAVLRECEAEAPDLAFIAETNEQISAGLWS
jgi:flagellar biosynthesis regulator FlaF